MKKKAPLCQIIKPAPWQKRALRERRRQAESSRTIGYDEQDQLVDWSEWRAALREKRGREAFERHEHKTPASLDSESLSDTLKVTQQLPQARQQELRETRKLPVIKKEGEGNPWKLDSNARLPAPALRPEDSMVDVDLATLTEEE